MMIVMSTISGPFQQLQTSSVPNCFLKGPSFRLIVHIIGNDIQEKTKCIFFAFQNNEKNYLFPSAFSYIFFGRSKIPTGKPGNHQDSSNRHLRSVQSAQKQQNVYLNRHVLMQSINANI